MDGINNNLRFQKLYVIGATNKPWSLEAVFYEGLKREFMLLYLITIQKLFI